MIEVKNKYNSLEYLCIFGGGAARGLTYTGVLQAMCELGVNIKSVAGASVGSLFAAFYAVGYNIDECKEIFLGVNFDLFKDVNFSLKPELAISKGELFYQWLKEIMEKKFYGQDYVKGANNPVTFADLGMDLHVVTTNITECKPVVFSRYNTPDFEVAKALRISASLPGLMKPVEQDGLMFVDGDLIKSQPLWQIDEHLYPKDVRILEFRLEGTKENGHIRGSIDYANAVISCLSNYATDHVMQLHEQKDKFDYISFDTKDILMFNLNISQQQRYELIDIGYETTMDFFQNKLPAKKRAILKHYEPILEQIKIIENEINIGKIITAKNKLFELFVTLCESKDLIDEDIYLDIVKFKNDFLYDIQKPFLFQAYKLSNKSKISTKIEQINKKLQKKCDEITLWTSPKNHECSGLMAKSKNKLP